MKAAFKSAMIIAAISAFALDGIALAAGKAKDPTKYDCRVVVGYRRGGPTLSKSPDIQPILACPHKDKMAAGQCETSWLWGMRCKK